MAETPNKYPWSHHKHPFYEWLKIWGAVLGIVALLAGFSSWAYSKYLGVEIYQDNPSLKVTFQPKTINGFGIVESPHMDFTMTTIIENHDYMGRKLKFGYILSPKKFQDLGHSPEWKFDNTRDISGAFLGNSYNQMSGGAIQINGKSQIQSCTSYRIWTDNPYSEKFINELLELEDSPVTYTYLITVDGVNKFGKGIVFNPLTEAIFQYKDWLTPQDDDPKASKLIQQLLNESILTKDQNGVYTFAGEINSRYSKLVAAKTKTPASIKTVN